MNVGMLVVCFAALVLAVVVSIRFGVNIGIAAYALAFLVGGFGMGLSASEVQGFFPVGLFFQLMVITLFYGFAVANGTMQKVADYVVYACRNRPALLPWALFAVAFVLCAIGCPPPGLGAALVALSVAVQKRTHCNYYLAVALPGFGASAGGFMPYGLFHTIVKGLLVSVGGADGETAAVLMGKIAAYCVVFNILCMLAVYLWAKGYRAEKLEMDRPEPMNGKQKLTLGIVGCVLLLLVVPAVLKIWFPGIRAFTSVISITSLSCIGAAVCSMCKVADEKEVIRKNIPWSLMLMIAGAVSLINVMNTAGLSDFLSGLFSESIPAGAYPIMFCLLGAAISFFVDTTGVVLPLFIPVAFVVSGGSSVVALYVAALACGSYGAGNCPLSTSGALALSQTTDEQRGKMFYTVWIGAFATVGIAAVMALLGTVLPVW